MSVRIEDFTELGYGEDEWDTEPGICFDAGYSCCFDDMISEITRLSKLEPNIDLAWATQVLERKFGGTAHDWTSEALAN